MRHVITVTDEYRCGTCGRPVGWTAFKSSRGKPWRDDLPDEKVVSFIRHWPEDKP